jgi:hypothetical protein
MWDEIDMVLGWLQEYVHPIQFNALLQTQALSLIICKWNNPPHEFYFALARVSLFFFRVWHEYDRILDGVSEGWVRPYVDQVYDFDHTGEAHTFIESRQNIGKV